MAALLSLTIVPLLLSGAAGPGDFPTLDPSLADLNTFSPIDIWERFDWPLGEPASRDVREDHGDRIRQHGAAGTVLLKNERNALPLRSPKSIAVFGSDATDNIHGLYNQVINYEYGTLIAGGGSGTGRASYVITPLAAIQAQATEDDALV